jgi:hypothetical protein
MPPPVRFAVLGGLAFGAAGGVVGLIIGLQVYAPTAWAAMFEVGLPAAFVGAVVGLGVGHMADGDSH